VGGWLRGEGIFFFFKLIPHVRILKGRMTSHSEIRVDSRGEGIMLGGVQPKILVKYKKGICLFIQSRVQTGDFRLSYRVVLLQH